MRHDAAYDRAKVGFVIAALCAVPLHAVAVEVIPAPAPKQADAAKPTEAAKPAAQTAPRPAAEDVPRPRPAAQEARRALTPAS